MGERSEARDLVLTNNQFANILDETKGSISIWVGPCKTSLAGTDKPVKYNEAAGKFVICNLEEAVQQSPLAKEGMYIVLSNPVFDDKGRSPEALAPTPGSGSNSLPKLSYGKQIVVHGPSTFPLWPGQSAKVIEGHHMHSNQFLVLRVTEPKADKDGKVLHEMGALFIVKGTDQSFYMPTTGIEVVPEAPGKFVRDAVTLERLEYSILLDESGNKRYVKGPDVVFPGPTEQFITYEGKVKFRARELNENTGIYVKVIADYIEDGKSYKVGDELFITGAEQKIYFPRQEHAIIKYDTQEVHHAIAIPAGEARYILDRRNGNVSLIKGPKMYLPDPRNEVVVRRILKTSEVNLWFPGNKEAIEVNREFEEAANTLENGTLNYLSDDKARTIFSNSARGADAVMAAAVMALAGDKVQRGTRYTPPRTVVLNTKYDGAVQVNVWTGYAVRVVSKTGERKVVLGPASILLNYDETLEVLTLSTGKPKNTDNLLPTVYLRSVHNNITDMVEVETKDLCRVLVKMAYRVNFEGDSDKWFNVENYVKLLCDHTRSLVKNEAKKHGIEEFYANAANIIRDIVLGVASEGKRPGRAFSENGMRIYDLEVLEAKINDKQIEALLITAQQRTVEMALQVRADERELQLSKKREEIKRQLAEERTKTTLLTSNLEMSIEQANLDTKLMKQKTEAEVTNATLAQEVKSQEDLDTIQKARLARERLVEDQKLAVVSENLKLKVLELEAQTKSTVDKVKAVGPDVIAALQAYGDKDLAAKLTENLSPLAILGGESLADVLNRILAGTALGGVMAKAKSVG